jgi:hypothetical protein
MLDRSGGLAIDLSKVKIRTVAASQGEHGWWRAKSDRDRQAGRPGIANGRKPPSVQ